MTEINLLRDNKLDSDYITEISYELLGLIQSDQIVIDIKKQIKLVLEINLILC